MGKTYSLNTRFLIKSGMSTASINITSNINPCTGTTRKHFMKTWLLTITLIMSCRMDRTFSGAGYLPPSGRVLRIMANWTGWLKRKSSARLYRERTLTLSVSFIPMVIPIIFLYALPIPNRLTPTVYSTDHEVFFQEITNEGRLETFLKRYMTKAEFLDVVRGYLDNKVNTPS